MDATTRAERLKQSRLSCGYKTARAAAAAMGWNHNTYFSNENGNADYSYKRAKEYAEAFGVRHEWLYEGLGSPQRPPPPMSAIITERAARTPIIGLVGADPSGAVDFDLGASVGDTVPLPPGGNRTTVALHVVGGELREFAPAGSLLYFDNVRARPSAARQLIGKIVVIEFGDERVFVGRLQQGSSRPMFDIESLAGVRLRDQRLVWVAQFTTLVFPPTAKALIRSADWSPKEGQS